MYLIFKILKSLVRAILKLFKYAWLRYDRLLQDTSKHLDLTEFAQYNDRQPYTCGGFCDVFKGKIKKKNISKSITIYSSQLEINIAIKRLRAHLKKDIVRPFNRELKIWSGLKHPNILPLLGYISKDIYLSFVSEWMDHGTAIQYVKTISPDINVIAQLSIGIARGLEYLHRNHIIHSDLKAANILISPSNEPLICDFGISCRLESTTNGGFLNSDSTYGLGSLRWMAPELFDSDGNMSHSKASDVWAYGMTIFELLTKKLPYDNIRIDPVIMFAIIQGQLPSPEDFQLFSGDMYAQKRLYELCKQCWISDPGKRVTSKDILEYMSPTDFSYDDIDEGVDKPPLFRRGKSGRCTRAEVVFQNRTASPLRYEIEINELRLPVSKKHKGVNRLLKNERFIQLDFTLPSFKPLAASGNWQLDAGKILDPDYLQGPATEPPVKEMRVTINSTVKGDRFFDINPGRIISVFDVLSTAYRFMHTPISSQDWDSMRSRGRSEFITGAFSRRIRTNSIDHESLRGACHVDTLGEYHVFKGLYYKRDVERDDGSYIPVFMVKYGGSS